MLRALVEQQSIAPVDRHLAVVLGRLGREDRDEVLAAVALVGRQARNGHVCVVLDRFAGQPTQDEEPEGLHWPELAGWREALRASPLTGDTSTPLVLDGADRLYLRRFWAHEQRVAEELRRRVEAAPREVDSNLLEPALLRLFPDGGAPPSQRLAARTAALRELCVIVGGPGTGKTFTVARVLALLAELAPGDPPRMLLLAPTGKAAARLAEAVTGVKTNLPCSDTIREAVPARAATIHRALRPRGNSRGFTHNRDNPLPVDVVVVDEASMVDIRLLRSLLEAVPASARVILLGDPNQLSSVEAGAVLGDICTPRGENSQVVVRLEQSFRFDPQSGLGGLARAIEQGDEDAALEILQSPAATDAVLVSGDDVRSLKSDVVRGFGPVLELPGVADRLRALQRFGILCAHRHGPRGVETVNRQAEGWLREAGLLPGQGERYDGRPVLVTRNDYRVGLFNGDLGLLAPEPGSGALRACFPGGEQDQLRFISPSRLPQHETAFALSVHKSQGSEFDEVVLLLPGRMTRVLSRELLYTAVTRARGRVTIYASAEVVRQTIATRAERASGLAEALWG